MMKLHLLTTISNYIILEELQLLYITMLKYHLIVPHKSQQNIGTFYHYLNLGSHASPYSLNRIHAFSIITLNPKQKLPTISNNDEGKFVTAAVPLKGKLKVDSKAYQLCFEEKESVLWNPKDISTVEGDPNAATFAYIAILGEQAKNGSIQLKKYESGTTISLQKSLAFVLEGKVSYKEGDIQVTIKTKPSLDPLPNLFYTRKCLQLAVEQDSIVLIVKD